MIPATPDRDTPWDLTICTVSFHNAPHLIANRELANHLNRGKGRLEWVVAENTPEGSNGRLAASDPRFRVIPGAEGRHRDNYHHTIALQKTLNLVGTRFVLVLDPDFYIVRPGWVADVLEHMVATNLAMFGVPWHPRYIDKYRYFPCVHCFFVDLSKVAVSDLDFRPTCPDVVNDNERAPPRPGVLGRLLDTLALRHRRKDYRDTGTRMYLRFANDPNMKYECATPVYRLPEGFPGKGNPLSLHSRLIEALLPDSLCYIPKRRDAFVGDGFLTWTQKNPSIAHWEQFMWHGRPFGFHMRRNTDKMHRDEQAELETLATVLQHFYQTAPTSAPSSRNAGS